jgi:hypothetical protein
MPSTHPLLRVFSWSGRGCALAVALAVLCALPATAWAGYGPFEWGESLKSVGKKLGKVRLAPRTDVEVVLFEDKVLRAERDEKVRLARLKKKPAADIRRLSRAKPSKARLSAHFYWVELGPLDAKVVLQFLDERLTAAEVAVLFAANERAAAGEILDLLTEKYGPARSRRGADAPGAPVVDVFEAAGTDIEAYQQPAVGGQSGFLRLLYRGREQKDRVETYLKSLAERAAALEEARRPKGPTPEELEAARRAALLQHL